MIKDIVLEKDDIAISNGDVVVGDARMQVCELLSDSNIGEWRWNPFSGWSLSSYIAAPNSEIGRLVPQIKEDLKRNSIEAIVGESKGVINIEIK